MFTEKLGEAIQHCFQVCGLSAVLKYSPLSMTGWLTKTEYACWVFIKEKATTNLLTADAETLEVL